MLGPGGVLGFLDQQEQQPQANPLLSDIGAQAPAYFGGGAGGAQGMFGGGGSVPEGLAQYFDQFGQARSDDPRTVAQQAGVSLGQLAGGLLPRGGMGDFKYNIPSDQGGFFSIGDLFGLSGTPTATFNMGPQGPGSNMHVARQNAIDTPSITTYGQQLPSTNNWRLLGMGPGWIMRNGELINTRAPEVARGMWQGADMGGGLTAEQGGNALFGVGLGTGASYGVPGLFARGGPAMAGWPGSIGWRNVFSGNV